MSEDDIRSKIVIPWLRSLGFDENNLSIEFSFLIRLGRSILKADQGTLSKDITSTNSIAGYKNYHPRADILIRNSDGKNLMVIEVKAPSEPLDDDARDQGISYARLLLNGNIAPFVIITNGNEAKIFDSITKERVDSKNININQPCFMAGFSASGEDLALRAEALRTLISISSDNLATFCQEQSKFRMRPIKGDSLDSAKKYIPALYIERKEAKERLQHLLDSEKRRVVVITAPPQVGKTNFVCHLVEQRLKQGHPCLFYPAIGITKSLLAEIEEDFEWIFGQTSTSPQSIHKKLTSILRRSDKKLLIVIDGWNETNIELARTIDRESERLSSDEIQIIITLTNVAASRLLIGEGDNPSFIAEAAHISRQAAQLIEIDPDAGEKIAQWSVVNINRYTPSEQKEAYQQYAASYNVNIPTTHQRVYEPYLLGIAMKLFQGRTLPDTLDEPHLLEQLIEGKIRRAIYTNDYDIKVCLSTLGKEMFTYDAPVRVDRVAHLWGVSHTSKIPSGFFDSALLSQVSNKFNLPSIDFYYGRERDYIIASWSQGWSLKLKNNSDIYSEFIEATKTEVGLDALRWFLKQPAHIKAMQLDDGSPPNFKNNSVKMVLLASLCDIASKSSTTPDNWLKYAINIATTDNDNMARIEAIKLVALLTDNANDLISTLTNEQSIEEFITSIISINEEYPFESASVSRVVLESLRTLHFDMSDESDESPITETLEALLSNEISSIRNGASTCLGHISPNSFFNVLASQIELGMIYDQPQKASDFWEGIKQATNELGEIYYGSYCHGWLESLREDIDQLNEEYERLSSILEPVISTFNQHPSIRRLVNLLEDLRPHIERQEEENTTDEKDSLSHQFIDIYTLPLPFSCHSDDMDQY